SSVCCCSTRRKEKSRIEGRGGRKSPVPCRNNAHFSLCADSRGNKGAEQQHPPCVARSTHVTATEGESAARKGTMLCRLATAASRRAPAHPLQQQQQQQALLATASLVVRGRPSSGAAATTATTAAPAAAAAGRAGSVPSRARPLSSATAAVAEETPP
ncbi:unnamed protein product, partial [Ectocarpus sp. 8 AP-2014]